MNSKVQPSQYVHITSTTDSIYGGKGILVGMYVNSTSSGTIKFEDTLTHGSGNVINNTITPAIGWHNLGRAAFNTGLSATVGATLDVTIYIQPQ